MNVLGFDTAPAAISQRALSQNFNLEEKERREQAQLNKDFYYGKQEQSLRLMNDDVDPVVINLLKPIINKRCSMLYSRPLIREFDGPAASVKALEQVYYDNTVDALLGGVDLLSELTGSCILYPSFDPSLPGKIRLVKYDATQFSVVGNDNDPSTADAISLIRIVDRVVNPRLTGPTQAPQIERVMQQQTWTTEEILFYEGSVLKGSMPNELGFIPFVNFKGEEVHDQYIGFPTADGIRRLNNQINQLWTHLAFTIKMQAGTPIVFSGFQSGETVVVHPGRAINIPNDATASVLSLNPKINETLEAVKYIEDKLYTTSSVPRISVIGSEGANGATSGRELMVRWFPLIQVFKEKSTRFEMYELQLANTILAILGMPPINEINIAWPEESIIPMSAEDDELERDIQFNIKTPIDEIMRRFPHLTETEAEAEWRANRDINGEQATIEPKEEEMPNGVNKTD